MSGHKIQVIRSIDDLIANGIHIGLKKDKPRVCPDQEVMETVNLCNNPKYHGSVCNYTGNYKHCPYYKMR